jgi:hypothetical protein
MLKYILGLGLSVMAAPAEDKFTSLPNATYTTDSYSGYLKVTATKELHYVYVES